MTTALALFSHALRMLIHDPATTVRILLPGLLLILASTIGLATYLPPELISPPETPADLPVSTVSESLAILLSGVAGIAGYVLIAIFWHRHVLLTGDARTGHLYPGTAVALSYVWKVIVVGFFQVLASIPVLMVVFLAGQADSIFIAGLAAGIVLYWVALRISLILPAAAMDRKMTVGESWQATASAAGPIWGLAALLSLLSAVVSLVIGQITVPGGSATIWLQWSSYLVEALISISVLTTLYGHLVEGRPLQ